MAKESLVLFNTNEGKALVRKHCRAAGILVDELRALIDVEAAQVGRQRKAGLWEQFEEIIDQMGDDS